MSYFSIKFFFLFFRFCTQVTASHVYLSLLSSAHFLLLKSMSGYGYLPKRHGALTYIFVGPEAPGGGGGAGIKLRTATGPHRRGLEP